MICDGGCSEEVSAPKAAPKTNTAKKRAAANARRSPLSPLSPETSEGGEGGEKAREATPAELRMAARVAVLEAELVEERRRRREAEAKSEVLEAAAAAAAAAKELQRVQTELGSGSGTPQPDAEETVCASRTEDLLEAAASAMRDIFRDVKLPVPLDGVMQALKKLRLDRLEGAAPPTHLSSSLPKPKPTM
jgi:hypothetical protein